MYRKLSAAALAFLIVSALSMPRSVACEEEGPGFVSCALEATLAPGDAANIVIEEYQGTLVAKNIVLRGHATFHEAETELLSGTVTVRAVLLTTGSPATFAENRGILWLQYAFEDPASGARLGSGEGYFTLERVADEHGASSMQGTVTIGGVERQFAGTGWAGIGGLVAALPPGSAESWPCASSSEECDDVMTLRQKSELVVTAAKPGFFFEGSRGPAQLGRQFQRAHRQLVRERVERLRVLRALR